MKAIVYRDYGGPEVLAYVDIDKPTAGMGQVRVRVSASSINAADYRMMRADPFLVRLSNGLLRPKRQVLGMDVAGIVDDVGPGVTRFRIGDRVFGSASGEGMGAFAEFAVMREGSLLSLPETIPFAEAAAVPLAGITAIQAVCEQGAVRSSDSVLIQGAGGGVGTLVVQVAKLMGAHVTAVCGPSSSTLVASLGADEVLDYTKDDIANHHGKYDVIVGVNGHRSLTDYKRCLKPGGRYVMVGGSNTQIFAALLWAPLHFMASGKRAAALTINESHRLENMKQLAHWMTAGKLKPLIDREFALSQAADAIRYVEQGHVRGKVVLRVWQP